MLFDATFWVAVSFVIFFGVLFYFKIPQKVNELLEKMISDIKKEIEESEKLRTESKTLLDKAHFKAKVFSPTMTPLVNTALIISFGTIVTSCRHF